MTSHRKRSAVISIYELFKIGIGPSSSHTMGPMTAACRFVKAVRAADALPDVARVEVVLYGSLAWTGLGHGADKAVILGLAGVRPDQINPDAADAMVEKVRQDHCLSLDSNREIRFVPDKDIVLDFETPTPRHPNTLQLTAFGESAATVLRQRWCSIGGGFIVREDVEQNALGPQEELPHSFRDMAEFLALGEKTGLLFAEMMQENETMRRPLPELVSHLDLIVETMMACIDRGLAAEGILPGGLKVKRRARSLFQALEIKARGNLRHAHEVMDHVSVYAIAVNEENAAGGRVVTAPTNGAAGVIPAVLRYYRDWCPDSTLAGLRQFLLTAAAIGALFKMNASISGAEAGCQGEVGVAAAMAAAGLAAALGGTNGQIENAAEIAMEHHLGLTCDPIGGLVQIPCIERNAFGAIKAINAASLALQGDGTHRVSLDHVIATMRQTGIDMNSKYKETSRGGLAVNFPEC
jgi:L-serine dehydratase